MFKSVTIIFIDPRCIGLLAETVMINLDEYCSISNKILLLFYNKGKILRMRYWIKVVKSLKPPMLVMLGIGFK